MESAWVWLVVGHLSNGLLSKSNIIREEFEIKMVKIYGLNLLGCWMKKKINEKSGYKLIYNSAKFSGRGERYYKKKHDKPYMPKKAMKSGTQGRKNKVLKRYSELTGSDKVQILDKGPSDKNPPTVPFDCHMNRSIDWLL